MKQAILALLSLCFVVYFGVGAFIYVVQRQMLYHPSRETRSRQLEPRVFEHEGETLNVWQAGPEKHTDALLYFGGNAEDVLLNLGDFRNWFPGHTLFLVNYRGYGGSSGSPSESALFGDALAIYDEIQPDFERISVIGRSLGSGVASFLASERAVSRLALVTPFDSVLNVAKGLFPIYPASLLVRDRFDSASLAKKIEAPVLVLIAEADEVIPRQRSDALVEALGAARTRVEVIPAAGHNDIGQSGRYVAALQAFMRR